MKKNKILLLLTICCLCFSLPVSAKKAHTPKKNTEKTQKNTEAPKGYFHFQITTDLPLTDTDVFKISFQNGQTVQCSARDESFSVISQPLAPGDYAVSGIEYMGINQDIIQQGFGMPKTISITTENETIVPFLIGSTALSGQNDYFVIQNNPVSEAIPETTSENTAENTTETVPENSSETAAKSQPSEEDVVESVKKKPSFRQRLFKNCIAFSWKKLIPVGILAIVGAICIFIYYKKNC